MDSGAFKPTKQQGKEALLFHRKQAVEVGKLSIDEMRLVEACLEYGVRYVDLSLLYLCNMPRRY